MSTIVQLFYFFVLVKIVVGDENSDRILISQRSPRSNS
jgi:hypothetical protein